MLGFTPTPATAPSPDPGRRPLKPGLGTVAGAVAAVAAAISFILAARTAVPYSIAALPHLYAAVRAWLARPFLFAAVHLIIFIIWKLSEHKHHADHRPEEDEFHRDKLGDLVPTPSPEILREISLPATEARFTDSSVEIDEGSVNLITIESAGDDETESGLFSTDYRVEIEKITVESAAVGEDDDSMEARWKAILQGGAAPVEKFTVPEGGGLGREATVDCNQMFEEFIKKNYEQIRVATALGDG